MKQALENEYEDDNETDITFHMPKNTEKVRFSFRGEKIAKVVGELAHKLPKQEDILEGVLGSVFCSLKLSTYVFTCVACYNPK